MNFLELVMKRQSVRKYSNIPVEREKLLRCLEAARLAPSASNSQPWKWIVVDDTSLRSQIAAETWNQIVNFNKFVNEATVLVVLVMEKPKLVTKIGMAIKKKEWPWIDIGIAAEHFCLQAAEDGLGTCMLGWFNEKPIKKILSIPESKTIGLIISVGYPPEGYKLREKTRKAFDEVVKFNVYS
jgi:nitroreductase